MARVQGRSDNRADALEDLGVIRVNEEESQRGRETG